MFRLLNIFACVLMLAVGPGFVFWVVKVPQPVRHDVQLAYLRDTGLFFYHEWVHSPQQDVVALADKGNLYAKMIRGEELFRQGAMDGKHYDEALPYLSEASETGLPEAQNALGVAYKNGLGVAQDKVAAYKWFKLAAAANVTLARHNLLELAQRMTTAQIDAGVEAEKIWLVAYKAKEFDLKLVPSGW